MFIVNQNVDWEAWLHILALLSHLFVFKFFLFIFAALFYPWVFLRNHFVNAEKTKWSNVMILTEKLGLLITRIIFVTGFALALYFIARSIITEFY